MRYRVWKENPNWHVQIHTLSGFQHASNLDHLRWGNCNGRLLGLIQGSIQMVLIRGLLKICASCTSMLSNLVARSCLPLGKSIQSIVDSSGQTTSDVISFIKGMCVVLVNMLDKLFANSISSDKTQSGFEWNAAAAVPVMGCRVSAFTRSLGGDLGPPH